MQTIPLTFHYPEPMTRASLPPRPEPGQVMFAAWMTMDAGDDRALFPQPSVISHAFVGIELPANPGAHAPAIVRTAGGIVIPLLMDTVARTAAGEDFGKVWRPDETERN